MFNLFNRATMIAVLAVVGLVAAADAQKKPQAPESAIQQIARPGTGASSAGDIAHGSPSPQWAIGWNYVHASNCYMFSSGGYTYLALFAQEGGYFYTNDSAYASLMETDCQFGNWIAFHVIDSSNDWDQILTFDYK
jgi:hypothetical protein